MAKMPLMTSPFVLVDFKFCAAHRLLDHPGKCRHLHGHNYRARLKLLAPAATLDGQGMVVDFGTVKNVIGRWIDDNWDHNIILNPRDPLLHVSKAAAWPVPDIFAGREPFVMPADLPNPTAECMAMVLASEATNRLPGYPLAFVEIQETDGCGAGCDVYQITDGGQG